MTLIAILNHPTTPILLSDMLMSIEGESSDIFLPTLGDLDLLASRFSMSLPFKATRMARKPFNIGDHTFVAWAGSISTGSRFKAVLEEKCAGRHATQEDIDTAFYEMNDVDTSTFSVICVGLPIAMTNSNWRNELVISHRNCYSFESKLYGKCLFGGSGAQSFVDFITARDAVHYTAHGSSIKEDTNAIVAASMCGNLVFKETLLYGDPAYGGLQPGQLLNLGCGGFYEAYTFTNRAVYSPKPAVYIHIQLSENGSSPVITRLYYVSNRNGNSVIASLIAEEASILENGEVALNDGLIDIVICPPFSDSKKHMHIRTSSSQIYEDDDNFVIDNVAVTLFRSGVVLPPGASAQLTVSERDEAEPTSFQSQQYAFSNPEDLPVVTLQFSSESGIEVVLDQQWLREILARFSAAHTADQWFVDKG